MKIAISSTAKDLEASIDPRFGRCSCFLIVETDDMSFKAFDNENIELSGGAGIQSAQFIASQGAKVILTGRCGPKAAQALSEAGVEMITGQSGAIRKVIKRFVEGDLRTVDRQEQARPVSTIDTRGQAFGGGTGMGKGRGRGMGGGRGMGRGKK
ncbi:NifB/NifX family molybdenum-iron cluster-binding protein [Thermodesulfobacteriota bacterium]